MKTLREQLAELGFDEETGLLIHQIAKNEMCPYYDEAIGAERIYADDDFLDKEIEDVPSFVAEDYQAIYFPVQYDGSTWVEKVYKNISKYLDYENHKVPYPGNG